MNREKINMLSTATIAFVTVLVAMGGFYFNLVKENIPLKIVLGLEFIFLILVLFFIRWIKRKGEQ